MSCEHAGVRFQWVHIVLAQRVRSAAHDAGAIVAWFRRGAHPTDRHRVNVRVFASPSLAASAFDRACATVWSSGDTKGHVLAGSGTERTCLSEVRESEGRCAWYGPKGTGRYRSHLLVLKGILVIEFHEIANEPRAEKDGLVSDIAGRLRPLAEKR